MSAYRSVPGYQRRQPDDELEDQLSNLGQPRVSFSYRGPYLLFRTKGVRINHKNVCWLYKQVGPQVAHGKGRERGLGSGLSLTKVSKLNERRWVELAHDALQHGSRIRRMTIIDGYLVNSYPLRKRHMLL